jgi:hypothetical protein
MISTPHRPAGVVALVALASAATAVWAEPGRPSAEQARAFEQFAAGAERLARARAAGEALAAHERPRFGPGDWEGMLEAFQSAAGAARAAEAAGVPRGPAPVPVDQLKSCASRAGALNLAGRAVRELEVAELRCGEGRGQLKERRAAAQAAEESWRALGKLLARLPDGSGVAELFPGRGKDWDAPLGEALRAYQESLAKQEARLERAQAEFKARAAGLAGAIAEAKSARDCELVGQWLGASTHAGTVSGAMLELAAGEGGFSGTAHIGGLRLPVKRVTHNGSSLVVTLGDGKASLSGTLAPDGRTYRGTFSSAEGPAAFTLHRPEPGK